MANLRKDTMHRLCDCDCNTPSPPGPSHIMPLSVFEEMMYKVAYASGYIGSKTDFREDLINSLNGASAISGLIIQKGSVEDFPDIGVENAIYIDTEYNQIYYWNKDGYYKIGAPGSDGLREGTILDGGDANTK